MQEALLTDSDQARDRHLAAAEQVARYLADSDSTDAEAFYWLAVAQWLVRALAMRMGMGEVLGEASWEQAEAQYVRAGEPDAARIAPRFELAKLYLDQKRPAEALAVLPTLVGMTPHDRLDEGMLRGARAMLAGPEGSDG